MSLADKFGISQSLFDAAKQALEEASEYQKKVQAHMAKKGIKSLSDMTDEQKKKFFNELDAMHKAKNEEVEQIDELGVNTLKSYTKKANDEVTAIKKKQAEHPRGHISGADADKKLNRQIGINQATKRIVKKDLTGVAEEVDLDELQLVALEAFMQTEDFEQLDELSKTTLGNYIKKRSHDVATMGAITRKHAMDSETAKKENNYTQQRKSNEKADKAFAKGWKHRQNIAKAVDKLTKEDLEFIESLNKGEAHE